MRKTQAYADWLRAKTGTNASVDIMEAVLNRQTRKLYEDAGHKLGDTTNILTGKKKGEITEASEEIISDFIADELFSGDTTNLENFLNELNKPTRNKFIQWILDIIDIIKQALTKGDKKIAAELSSLERRFTDMLKDSQKELAKSNVGQKTNENYKKNKNYIDNKTKTQYNNITKGEENYGQKRQEFDTGRNAGVSGQTFTSADSRVEKRFSALDGRENYRGIGSTLKNILIKKGATPVELKQINSAKSFYDAIAKAKRNNSHGAFVTQYEVSHYQQNKLFLSEDNSVGVAVTSDGDIISVFKNPDYKGKKAVSSILLTALENGGVKLDNFNGGLSRMYWQHGFVPVARTKFEREFAPDDWNYERDGEPDIIFWMHSGESAETVASKIGDYGEIPDLTKLPLMEYEKAAEYRDQIIEKSKARQHGIAIPSSAQDVVNRNTRASITADDKFSTFKEVSSYRAEGKTLSDSALEAYQNGEMPKSVWTRKDFIFSVGKINPKLNITEVKVSGLKELFL